MLIDAHCHLDFEAFDLDRRAVVESAHALGVRHFVVPATTRRRWPQVLALGKRPDVSVCLGLHPYFIAEHQREDLTALAALLDDPGQRERLVAIGECGIDGRLAETLEAQWHYFEGQLQLARQYALPVVIHSVKAHDQISKRLRQLALPKGGLVHAFSGSYPQAVKLIEQGIVLGLGGALTYPRGRRLREVVAKLPDDSFVLETDSPDMPLCGYQGQRNEPCRVAQVCEQVASLRHQPAAEIAALSSANAARVFNLALT